MSYPKLWRVVETIKKKTDNGTLKWSQTEASGVFQVAFPSYAVRISKKENSSSSFGTIVLGKEFHVFSVFNDEGDLVESASTYELIKINNTAPTVMSELYETARRQAMGVEDALDSILDDLDDEPPF